MSDTPSPLDRFILDGDQHAFAQIVTDYQAMVWGICVRILRHPADAEDAAQETFIRLATRARQIRGSLGGWLQTTAYRIAIDRRERLARERAPVADESMTGAEAPRTDELIEEALRAMAALDPDDRDLLQARFVMGRSQEEIARDLGITQQAVARREERALERLRRRMRQGTSLASVALLLAIPRPPPHHLGDRIASACAGIRPVPAAVGAGTVAGAAIGIVVAGLGLGIALPFLGSGNPTTPASDARRPLGGTWTGTMEIITDGQELGVVPARIAPGPGGVSQLWVDLPQFDRPIIAVHGSIAGDGTLSGTAAQTAGRPDALLDLSGTVSGPHLEMVLEDHGAPPPATEPDPAPEDPWSGLEVSSVRIRVSATAAPEPGR
ncbi:MAG: hypothetical protein RLZZ127_540 [Planctomycetota bacterium]|jgi:RNA polymerase sigma factor (sigma-70 family)